MARSAPLRKQNGALEIEKNLGVPEKQYIVGNCKYLLVNLAVTYVDTYIQNVNWAGVVASPSSDAAGLIAH